MAAKDIMSNSWGNGITMTYDTQYKFFEMFDAKTGLHITHDRIDTGTDPFQRSYPSLLDVGIMGTCVAANVCPVGCYQGGAKDAKPNMTYDDFASIIDQVKGLVFQCALGGRGDPNTHPDFARMLYKARMEGVVPNYTTSGLTLNLEASRASAEHCGAVAVSWHNQKYTYDAIDMLQAAGCVTNIHFVLSNESVEYATSALRNGLFPNVNAVIFLLHKPVGLGMTSNVLKSDDRRLVAFFKAIEEQQLYKIGFDSCSIQGVMRLTNKFNLDSMDTCEGARFSMYISPDMYATPCSFDKDLKWGVSLRDHTISEAWESDKFESFRQVLRNGSAHCEGKCAFWTRCTGACPIVPEITLCD